MLAATGTEPLIPSVGVIINVFPLQTVVLIWETTGIGFIYAFNINVAPTQIPVVGTTEYCA